MKNRSCFWIVVQENYFLNQLNNLALTKMFCCTILWGNQLISVALSETSAPINRYLGRLLIWKLLQLSWVWRVTSPDFSSFHRCSIGVRSGLIEAISQQTSVLFWAVPGCLFTVCFGSSSCWRSHDLKLTNWAAHFAPESLDSPEVSL